MLFTSVEVANDFFKSNSDFLKPETVCDCHLAQTVGDYIYLSCYIKTNTVLDFNVIYDPGLFGNLVKNKESAFIEDDYWSAFNKGSQFGKEILDNGLGAALVILEKESLSIYTIYYFKDTYNIDTPVKICDVVDNKIIINYLEYNYVFASGSFLFLSFVDSGKFLKMDYLWVAYPYYGYDAFCNWHFINFKELIESPIHALTKDNSSQDYEECHYDFEKCLFVFSNEARNTTMDFESLTSIPEKDREIMLGANLKRAEEKKKNQDNRLKRMNDYILLKPKLNCIVSHWETIDGVFHYCYLFNYYPTNCNIEVTENDWKNRRLIWNFKNEPDKKISSSVHDSVLDVIIPQIKDRLFNTFGKEDLQYISLFCLPASTSSKNIARYSKFSSRLCEETKMKNAYHHYYIMQDGLSKNAPDNKTGRSIQPIIKYNEGYFKNKYVLLFDDIVTRGDTMLKYKAILEKMGAIVIGGICIGKTIH